MENKTIVILGGGVGGIITANELRRTLPPEHRIILVEKNPVHTMSASLLWLMTGDRMPEEVQRPVSDLLRRGIETLYDEVLKIDIQNQRIETNSDSLNYDYLIIALGAELNWDMAGLRDAHTFYTFEGAIRLRDSLEKFRGGNIALVVVGTPYKCPGAPHEGVMLISDYFQEMRLRDKVEVHLFTPEPQPMPVTGPEPGNAVRRMLESKGILFHPLHKVTSVNSKAREISFEGKELFKYDLLIVIPPHKSPQVVKDAGLINEAGWIPVNRNTLQTNYTNIYAIGDITSVSIPGRWKPDIPLILPKAGVFAHYEAEVVARRIAAEIMLKPIGEEFSGIGYCALETGGNEAGFAYGDFFAQPSPQIKMYPPGEVWHLGKVLFEKWWLSPFGIKKSMIHKAIILGGKFLKIPVKL